MEDKKEPRAKKARKESYVVRECEEKENICDVKFSSSMKERYIQHSHWQEATPNRTLSCMKANYPYAIKNQRGARNTPSRGYFCDELVLYGIRLLA